MALLTLLWVLYFLIHSFLASQIAKRIAATFLGDGFKFYRIIYNLIAVLSFVAIWYYQSQLATHYLFVPGELSFLIGSIILITGIILGGLAFFNYRWQEFAGIDQIRKITSGSGSALVIHGFNSYVRHPLYFAAILILIGYFLISLTLQVLIFTLITFIYLVIGTKLEEKKLIDEYGEAYLEYQKRVKMLIPYIF